MARNWNLSYVFEPFVASRQHGDNYTSLNDMLGLSQLFSALGAATAEHADELSFENSAPWTRLNRSAISSDGCNVFAFVEGYQYCRPGEDGLATIGKAGSCFRAPESEFVYQSATGCFRRAVALFGTAFDQCIFARVGLIDNGIDGNQDNDLRVIPDDTIIVVWHVRVGDVILHQPDDPFYANVLNALRLITKGYKMLLLLVGKGNEYTNRTHSVTLDYVKSISTATDLAWTGSGSRVPDVIAPAFTFSDAFVAMMQADVLIGSGSSLPIAAALASGETLFFSPDPKHGYNYGAEMMVESVDVAQNGSVLDSLRRLKVVVHERMRTAHRRTCRFQHEAQNS